MRAGRTLPHVLVVGHYPLEVKDRAPVVRIWAMVRALASVGRVTLVAGRRAERARRLAAYWRSGALAGVDAVYVESASSAATPADLAFLWRVRRAGIPLGIYVRDAYQKFPQLYPPKDGRERLLAVLYEFTVAAYGRLADRVFFPTEGLAAVFPGISRKALLPPAGEVLTRPPGCNPDPQALVYVGAGGPHDGVDLLLAAFTRMRLVRPGARLTLVMRRQEWPPAVPAGVRLVAATDTALDRILWQSGAAVIPRPDTVYNRLALPVKLFDYWSHQLPVVATVGDGPSALAEWIGREGAGITVAPEAGALAQALVRVTGDVELRGRLAEAAATAVAERHHWRRRAQELVQTLLASPPPRTRKPFGDG